MSGLYTLHVPDLRSEDGQGSARALLSGFTQQLVRGRLIAIPWYEVDIPASHGFNAMDRPGPGTITLTQGIVAPVDLALVAFGYNFRGTKTGGDYKVRLSVSTGGGPFNPSDWDPIDITSNNDHGLLAINPDVDVVPEGSLWVLESNCSGFSPTGSIDIEVYSYLAPV